RWILVAAFLTASAFDVKHTALFGAIPLAALLLFAAWRQPKRASAFTIIVIVVGLFGPYWQVRAYLLTGNPVFPGTTSSAAPAAGIAGAASWLPGPIERYVRVIHDTQFAGDRFFERPLATPLGIAFVMFWPAWLLWRKKDLNPVQTILLLFVGAYL